MDRPPGRVEELHPALEDEVERALEVEHRLDGAAGRREGGVLLDPLRQRLDRHVLVDEERRELPEVDLLLHHVGPEAHGEQHEGSPQDRGGQDGGGPRRLGPGGQQHERDADRRQHREDDAPELEAAALDRPERQALGAAEAGSPRRLPDGLGYRHAHTIASLPVSASGDRNVERRSAPQRPFGQRSAARTVPGTSGGAPRVRRNAPARVRHRRLLRDRVEHDLRRPGVVRRGVLRRCLGHAAVPPSVRVGERIP